MEFDEKELRREIAFAIRNIHGKNDPNPLKFLPPFKSRCFSFLFWLSLFREIAAAHALFGGIIKSKFTNYFASEARFIVLKMFKYPILHEKILKTKLA